MVMSPAVRSILTLVVFSFSRQTAADAKPAHPKAPQLSPHKISVTALSGGIAGAIATLLLYPLDTAKTLRQSDPSSYKGVASALWGLVSAENAAGGLLCASDGRCFIGVGRSYSGVLPATFGAVPSSALYFGTYETVRREMLARWKSGHDDGSMPSAKGRLAIHALSAASGNAVSSAIYVPKEYVKQRSQATGQKWVKVVRDTLRDEGIRGCYRGYIPTFVRNVPGAVLRFGIYEELKLRLLDRWCENSEEAYLGGGIHPIYFLSGACAGALSSGIMTPVDVIKTRIVTGSVERGLGMTGTALAIIKRDGMGGLYAGARARMVWSSAFSAIGFGTFEACKSIFGMLEKKVEAKQHVIEAHHVYGNDIRCGR